MKRRVRRTFIGLVGGLVVAIGVILIPYPGPGWLIVFAGLGILSTEYDFARRWLVFARTKYSAWDKWVLRQNFVVRALIWLGTAFIVVVTIWLVNGYALLNYLFDLRWDWLDSPLLSLQ